MDDEILKEFLLEAAELLDQLDHDFIVLERDPTNTSLLANIFRSFHSIKGAAGFLELGKLERLAHVSENVLSRLRDGKMLADASVVGVLLNAAGALREMLGVIEATGAEGGADRSELVAQLEALAAAEPKAGSSQPPKSAAPGAKPTVPAASKPAAPPSASPEPSVPPEPAQNPPQKPARADDGRADSRPLGEILISRGSVRRSDVSRALREQKKGDPRRLGEILVELGVTELDQVREGLESQKRASQAGALADSMIRVDVSLLDKLMNLAGELVLARNQILQFARTAQDRTFLGACQRLSLITTELQEGVMKTRMQPIGTVWSKFPRVIRQLAVTCGKQARIEMEGQDTELDKTIIEAIKEPLTHFIRNSIDHGLESPAARKEAGKPAEGVVRLSASQEGGLVSMEIADDGRGIDVDVIRAKAIEKKLVTPIDAQAMGDSEVLALLFAAGFSTADKVTKVSGRGVGMDVVRTNIERIGGTVDIQTELGRGTTFKIKIPLTLAIIPALLVRAGRGLYALPQTALLEVVRVSAEDRERKVEFVSGAPVYRLRGDLLPLVHLDRELKLARLGGGADMTIVVLQAGEHAFGLVVDRVEDTAEIVVKPLRKQVKGIGAFAGATILGNGSVSLILDVMGLAQGAKILDGDRLNEDDHLDRTIARDESSRLVLFRIGDARYGAPLELVTRLEEFARESIESSRGYEVVQYRGDILPLVSAAELLGVPREAAAGRGGVPVLVCEGQQGQVGLVVDQIVDIVDARVPLRDAGRAVFDSIVVRGEITDLIDPRALAGKVALPEFSTEIMRSA